MHRDVVALIEQRDFAGLERVLGAFQTAFEADAGARLKLETAYEVFDRIPRSALGTLDAWCQSHPNSYAAHMARAALFYRQGLDARGTKFIGKTPEENLRTMRFFFEKAQADLERSLTLTPKPYLSRLTLMSVARIGGSRRGENAHYLEAVKLVPQSIELRLDHMATLEPRWGGSHKAMQAYADESRAQLTDAKAADRLAARIPAYRHGLDANHADAYAQRG